MMPQHNCEAMRQRTAAGEPGNGHLQAAAARGPQH